MNGTIVRQAEMDGNGNFTFPNVATFIQPGDTVELVGVDSRYQEQKRIPVNVDDSMSFNLTVNQNPYIIGTSTALTGTYGKDLSRVRLFVNDQVVAQAQTDGAGNYTFPNAAQFIKSSSDVVKVVGVDSTFAQRAETPVNVQGSIVYDYSLTADSYTLNQANLTGKYGKDIFKVRLVVNGTIVRQAEMDGNGNYTFPNIASYIKAGDKVEIVGVDSRYQEQNRIPVTVNENLDYTLTVVQNPYIVGTSKAITGTYGKDISRVRLFVNGTVVAQATTDSAGNYSFANAAQYITSDKDVVKVVGVDSSYVQRAEVAVPVQGGIVYDYALTVDPYRLNQANLTGTYGKDIARVRLFINDVVVRQAEVDGNGNYTFPNIGPSIKAGDKVEVVGVDSRFVEQKRIPVTVNENLDYTLTVAENPYTIGTSTALSGTYGEDINQVRLVVNGNVVTQAQLDGSGNYTIPNAAQFIKSATDNVQVVAVDKQFVQQASQTVNLVSKPVDYALTAPASYELKGKQIIGTYGKDITAVRLLVNGEVKAQGQLDGNGNYTFNNVDSFITAGTDKVEVVGVDSTYQEQARKTIAVTVPKDYSLTQDSYKIGQDALTGKYGADIKAVRLYKDNVLVVNRNVDGSGSFTFPEAYVQIKDDGANYEIVGVDASNVDQIRIPVVISGSLDFAATANPYTLGDATITGTVGADVKRLQLVVNGTVKRLARSPAALSLSAEQVLSLVIK
ncbi:lipoprotein [Listeria floridensis FSL S10-1187]|uniref:Lipoprotein n=1 Tax=Listeria floridensis FSL S10-1187 TaxID=1265817 RepID=A0ABP3ATM1_9LIST|nr:lipoprotein [Listeria floridensis FSL S10-1187]